MNTYINDRLSALSESDYKAFSHKLIPTAYMILGVRMPALRALAKELSARPDLEAYLDNAEYTTYEHVLLYGLTLGCARHLPLETVFRRIDPLILRFDNWAHVDSILSASAFKIFGKHTDEALVHFLPLKTHEGEFAKRFFVIFLMEYFMDEERIDIALKHLSEVPQGQYYVDMAIAWAICNGLIKYYDRTFPVLERRTFSGFVHNKAIQKARESYRIAPEIKELLRGMKIN
jgi:3-methyladenine DNA glycosylase AlkD